MLLQVVLLIDARIEESVEVLGVHSDPWVGATEGDVLEELTLLLLRAKCPLWSVIR